EQHRPAGTTQGFVGRRRHHVRERNRRRVSAAGDQTCDVGDVGREYGAHLTGDLGENFEVDDAWDGGPARPDELGVLSARDLAHLVIVDAPGFPAYSIVDRAQP